MKLAEEITQLSDDVNHEEYCDDIQQYIDDIKKVAQEGKYSYHIQVKTLDGDRSGEAKYLSRFFEKQGFNTTYYTLPSYSYTKYFVVVSWG